MTIDRNSITHDSVLELNNAFRLVATRRLAGLDGSEEPINGFDGELEGRYSTAREALYPVITAPYGIDGDAVASLAAFSAHAHAETARQVDHDGDDIETAAAGAWAEGLAVGLALAEQRAEAATWRPPLEGHGYHGARRSAQIVRDEANTLDPGPRYNRLILDVAAWEQQAIEIGRRVCLGCGKPASDHAPGEPFAGETGPRR